MSAVLCRPHRADDPISESNVDIYDTARGLVQAVALLDRLGIVVITVQADRRRNQRVMVEPCAACDALGGVAVMSNQEFTMWSANRYGIEIRWMRQTSKVAP